MTIGRGKRLMAWALLLMWFLVSWRTFNAVITDTLSESALRTVEAIYWTYSGGSLFSILTLLGLDASAAQIIPAIRGQNESV